MRAAELKYTPVFERNWNADTAIVVNRGGTRSSKSYSICQQLFIWLLTGQITKDKWIPNGVASIVRKFGATLERTILRDFKEIVEQFGYTEMLVYNITKREFTFKDKSGTRIVEFFGADDQQKIRGSKRNILYCNEANELNWDKEFFQLKMRTTDKIIIDFNPDNEFVWIKTELEDKKDLIKDNGLPVIAGGCELIISTYKDNPFLEPLIVSQIEAMKYEDPVKWRVYGEGGYGVTEGMVFSRYDICNKIPDGAKHLGYGLDFGYSNDPSVLVSGWLSDNKLYLKEIFRKHGMTNQDIDLELNLHGISKRDEIYADSAEPKSVEELRRKGWAIQGVTKGRDSIRVGIDIMKRYEMMIHFESEELMKEVRGYRWEMDRDGRTITPERPKGGEDHGLDSARYLCLAKLAKPQYRKYKIY
jgi:phage terminase large subunit